MRMIFWRLLFVRRVALLECDGQDAGATATADQALIRASKAHTGMRREIPVSVGREYGECRSLTNFGEFSDRLRHPGHRIVLVQVSVFSFCPGPVPAVQVSASPQCGETDVTVCCPPRHLWRAATLCVDHAAPSVSTGSVVWAMAQMKPTSSRATAVMASGDFLPRAIRRR
jgi:hypothetical protein